MFTEWMISSTPKKEKGKTGITTILSFLLHATLIGAMIVIPILTSSKLPKYQVNAAFLAPPPPPPPPPPPKGGKKINKKLEEKLKQLKKKKAEAKKTQQLVAPLDIPKEEPQDTDVGLIASLKGVGDEGVPGGVDGGIPGGVDDGSLTGLIERVGDDNLDNVQTVVQPPKIIKRVAPVYPPLAAKIRAQGDVVLQCVTDIYGNVVSVKVLSSPHPLLTKAAVDAVRQWKFEPMIINGIPRPVRFVLRVKFRLTR